LILVPNNASSYAALMVSAANNMHSDYIVIVSL